MNALTRRRALVLALTVFVGCGGEDGPTTSIPGLATQQGAIVNDRCRETSEPRDHKQRRNARRAERQLRALVRALREQPDARVRTMYFTDTSLFDSGGEKTEVLSVRGVAEHELAAAEVILTELGATGQWAACIRRVKARIRAALE